MARDLGRGPGDSRESQSAERGQRWLHEHDRDRPDCDGHPDRTDEEIAEWAREHDLPYFEDEVHFPDVRIEY